MSSQLIFPSSNPKEYTSPANEILLHKCRKHRTMREWTILKIWKNHKSSQCINAETKKWRKKKWNFPFKSKKNLQVKLMSFCYKGIVNKFSSPSNELMLHRTEWKGKYTSPANEFLLHPRNMQPEKKTTFREMYKSS